MNVTIHIGYHKTGSTLLQKYLFKQAASFYAGPDSESLFISREVLDNVQSETFDAEAFRADVLERSQGKQQHIILSHEEFSGWPDGQHPELAARAADNLHAAFPEAKILCVVRNQADWLKSLYAFRCSVKGSETRPFYRYLEEQGRAGLFEKMRYDKLVAHYFTLFSPEKCMVLPFEMLKEDKAGFFRTVSDYIGYVPAAPPVFPVVNKSSKRKAAIDACRYLNSLFSLLYQGYTRFSKPTAEQDVRFRFTYYSLRSRFITFLSPVLPKARLEYPAVTIARLDSLFATSNTRLAKLINIDLSRYGYATK